LLLLLNRGWLEKKDSYPAVENKQKLFPYDSTRSLQESYDSTIIYDRYDSAIIYAIEKESKGEIQQAINILQRAEMKQHTEKRGNYLNKLLQKRGETIRQLDTILSDHPYIRGTCDTIRIITLKKIFASDSSRVNNNLLTQIKECETKIPN
jgi:hypothetical protein